MAKVIAICNNVPDTINSMLNELGYNDVKIIQSGTLMTKKDKFCMILSFLDFKNNLKLINSEQHVNSTVFLFCPVIKVKSFKNIIFLDVVKNSATSCLIRSLYKDPSKAKLKGILDAEHTTKKVKEIDKEFKYHLVESMQTGSLLNPMMTLLYSVKAEAHIRIKEMIFNYFLSKKTIAELEKDLIKSYEWGSVSKNCRIGLINLLQSDIGKTYKDVFTLVSTKKKADEKFNLASIAKKRGIDDYEIKYIMSTLMSKKKKSAKGKSLTEIYNARENSKNAEE